MKDIAEQDAKTRCRWCVAAGRVVALLSMMSILLSVGMPGVGWLMAALMLFVASASAPLCGSRPLALTIVLSIVHLVSFGPFAGLRQQDGVEGSFVLIFIVVPFAIAIMVLYAIRQRVR